MSASSEREGFSGRLRRALREAGYRYHSATKLTREFNARFQGPPISSYAMRKWLGNEAIPTQDKVRTLAEWLNVGSEWLRFGENLRGNEGIVEQDLKTIGTAELAFISDLGQLDESDLGVVREVARLLVCNDARVPDLKRLVARPCN